MAPETQPSTSENSQNLEPWSKGELENALAHLERLQNQLDHLRFAIPDLVKPLKAASSGGRSKSISANAPVRTKADVFISVREVAVQKAEELRVLGEEWSSEATQRVFERARESEGRDGDLGRCVEVSRWGWAERAEGREREDEEMMGVEGLCG